MKDSIEDPKDGCDAVTLIARRMQHTGIEPWSKVYAYTKSAMASTAPSSTASTPANTPPTSANGTIFNQFLRRSNPEFDRLLIACQKNNVSQVRRLLVEDHVDPSHANPAGQSALHIAAWWGHVDCLDVLLQHGANLHAKNTLTGATPLHCVLQSGKSKAVKERYLACIEKLLQAGADPDAKDDLGRTPLEYLEENEMDREEVIQIFESMKHVNSQFRDLLHALYQKEANALEEVQQQWLDLTTDDGVMGEKDSTNYEEGMQQLQSLLCNEMTALMEEWIDRVDKINDEDSGETSATDIDHAFYAQRLTWIWERLVETSKESSNGNTKTRIQSARKTCLDLLGTAFLHRYGRVHKQATCGESLLLEDDIMSDWSQVATLLAECGKISSTEDMESTKDVTSSSDTIEQAWMTIARRNYFALAKLWRDQLYIDPISVVNGQGMSVLQFAARSGHVHLVQWLLEIPENDDDASKRLLQWVQQSDKQGNTALSAAQVNQNHEVALVLQDFIDRASSQQLS